MVNVHIKQIIPEAGVNFPELTRKAPVASTMSLCPRQRGHVESGERKAGCLHFRIRDVSPLGLEGLLDLLLPTPVFIFTNIPRAVGSMPFS